MRDATTENTIWWDNNKAMSPAHFDALEEAFLAYAQGKELFVQDLHGGADLRHRVKVRIVTELAWHSLFVRHLLLRPERVYLCDGDRRDGHNVLEARVTDDAGGEVADGTPGELLIRHSAATPRRGFFSGYLKDGAATEAAWQGGWFHTGDIVSRDADGMLHFVDRKKNIIRRSGENIAAAEVEALLLTHPDWRLKQGQRAEMSIRIDGEVFKGTAVANEHGLLEVDGASKDLLKALYNGRKGRIEVGDYSFDMTNLADAAAVIDKAVAHLQSASR
mgnify:CR=1 FL=1